MQFGPSPLVACSLTRHMVSLLLGGLLLGLVGSATPVRGDLVAISTSEPSGVGNRDSNSNFIGILDSAIPTTINSLAVSLPSAPAGEAFAVGDLVGRDVDASGGGRIWDYVLDLPSNAVLGTGFSNISFSGDAFERSNNNLDGDDELVWELFLNGGTVAVDSATTGGDDFTSVDISLADVGGSTINEVLVRLTVSGFDDGNEWFATRGILSANFETIPEPNARALLILGCIGFVRRRSKQI